MTQRISGKEKKRNRGATGNETESEAGNKKEATQKMREFWGSRKEKAT